MADELFRLGIFQSSSELESPADRLAALREQAEALTSKAELLLAPELFMSGYAACAERAHALAETAEGPFAEAVSSIAKTSGLAIAYGFPERDRDRLYNSALAFGADGKRLTLCRKLHMPMTYERHLFTPGDRLTLFYYRGLTFGMLICYDVEFPECARILARQGVEILLVPTALTTHWTRLTTSMVPTRAFENGIFLAYANHAGIDGTYEFCGASCLVGPLGFDIARAGDSEEVIVGAIDRQEIAQARARLPYLDDLRSGCSLVVRDVCKC